MLRIKSELFGTIELPIEEIEGGDAWYSLSQFLDVNVFVDYEDRQVRASIYPVWTDKGTVNTNYEIESINMLSDQSEESITYDFDPFYCPNMTDQEKCVEFFANNGVKARVFREEDVVVQIEHLEVQVDKEEVKLRARLYDSTVDDRHKSESEWCVRIYDPSKCDKNK